MNHYTILNKLYDKGILTDGAMLEFIQSHSGVTYQPPFDAPWYNGINPYALGFAMMQDICRICDEPTEEDRYWFPNFAGCKDHLNVLKDAWKNYRDESFVRQFLSPKVIRDFKLFSLENVSEKDHYLVTNIHNEKGYRRIRSLLADYYTLSNHIPNIEAWDVNITGDRELKLKLTCHDGCGLDDSDANATLQHIANLWGYDARLITYKPDSMIQLDHYFKNPIGKSNRLPNNMMFIVAKFLKIS